MKTEGGARSIYIHAPYCARRCPYCDFAVEVRRSPDPTAWIDTLKRELSLSEQEGSIRLATLETVYVGGGTPSLFGPDVMRLVREVLNPWWPSAGPAEWTAEANPESFTNDVAAGWAAAGVTRVSLGVQSFDAPALEWMGRLHGADGAERAVAAARSAGIDNVSLDLMFGLPARLGRDWTRDLDRALALEADHISLYGLTVEEGTPLGAWVRRGMETPANEEQYGREFLEANARLVSAGFEHYEVSNFAKPGRAALHNTRYWDGSSYLGVGLGAHSYRHPMRRWNVRDLDDYVEALQDGVLPVAGVETLESGAERLETLWLGLRTRRGLRAESLPHPARELLHEWRARGLAAKSGERIHLTPRGWLLLDELALDLDAASGPEDRALALPGGLGYT